MKNIALLLTLLLCPASEAADFTALNPGGRANGMGTAFGSVADDAYGIFYNPAGLSGMSYLEAGGGFARRLAPARPVGEANLVYIRPNPDIENKAAGFGYHALRQGGQGEKDTFLFGQGQRFTLKYFQQPVWWGYNFRITSLRYPAGSPDGGNSGRSHFGLGGDAGLLLSANNGLRTGLVLSDVNFGLGKSLAAVTLANSIRLKGTLFAADLRVRGGHAEFFPGLERPLFNDLLRLRAGRGVKLGGVDYLAAGLGINLLPWVIDITASLPWKGFHVQGGVYEVSVVHRFGAPTFSERFVGDAAGRARELREQIDGLRQQRLGLENSIMTLRVNRGVMESELAQSQSRLRDLEDRLKETEVSVLDAQFRLDNPPPPPPPAPRAKPPEKWPRRHTVQPGETLRSISSKYYGNPNLWERIYQSNEKLIFRGLPREGSVLEIPPPPAK